MARRDEDALVTRLVMTMCLEYGEPSACRWGAFALGKLGEHAAPAVPALIAYLEHRRLLVRESAADALGNLGEHAAPAVPALTKCLEDRVDFVRRSAAAALGKVGQQAALADLAKSVSAKE